MIIAQDKEDFKLRVLVLFHKNLDDLNLANHNDVKNSL